MSFKVKFNGTAIEVYEDGVLVFRSFSRKKVEVFCNQKKRDEAPEQLLHIDRKGGFILGHDFDHDVYVILNTRTRPYAVKTYNKDRTIIEQEWRML